MCSLSEFTYSVSCGYVGYLYLEYNSKCSVSYDYALYPMGNSLVFNSYQQLICQISVNKMILHRVKSCLFLAKRVIIQVHIVFICKRENHQLLSSHEILQLHSSIEKSGLSPVSLATFCIWTTDLVPQESQSQGTFSFSVS